MLVSGGNLFHHGKLLGMGDPIEDVENWVKTTLQIHLRTGRILDVTEEQAERLREQQKAKDVRALGQRAIRTYQRAKYATQAAYGQVELARKALEDAEQAFQDAEQAEFEAADKLHALRDTYGDEAIGLLETAELEPEPVSEPSQDEPEPTADDHGFSALSPDELRGKAVGVVGGYTRAALVGKLADWWGVNVYELKSDDDKLLIPKGAKKDVIRDAAIKVFEARYRIAELVESLDLDESKKPSGEVLMAIGLEALGAVVPTEAASALEAWKDSIRPTAPADEPEPEPEPEPDAVETEDLELFTED